MRVLSEVIDLFFPKICPVCGKIIDQNKIICYECESKIPPLNREKFVGGKWYFDELFYRASYGSIVGEIIRSYKYKHHISLDRILADFFIEMLEAFPYPHHAVLTTVPITFNSYKEKGFDHMELIAKKISKSTGLKFLKLLDVVRQQKSQVGSSIEERQKIISGKYAVRIDNFYITSGDIILLDDVFTTGSTVNECAKILKEAGAKHVWVYALAKASMVKKDPKRRQQL